VPVPNSYQRQKVAKVERRDAKRQERIRQADLRRAGAGDWGACERIAREAMERNKARLLSN